MSRPNLFFVDGLAIYTLSMRLMPYGLSFLGVELERPETFYPWNFSPMAAFCLFGGAYFAQKRWAYLLPVTILFASDLGILALTGKAEWAFHKNMVTVYGCFLLMAAIGTWLRGKQSIAAVLLTGIVGETLYFLITNCGEWWFSPTYAKDLAGLEACYLLGLPFFKLSLASTLVFSTLIFSPFILKERKAKAIQAKSPTVAAS